MDETLEKIVLDETSSTFSLMSLFLDADIVVKSVIVILIFASIWSWTIIFSKYWPCHGQEHLRPLTSSAAPCYIETLHKGSRANETKVELCYRMF